MSAGLQLSEGMSGAGTSTPNMPHGEGREGGGGSSAPGTGLGGLASQQQDGLSALKTSSTLGRTLAPTWEVGGEGGSSSSWVGDYHAPPHQESHF